MIKSLFRRNPDFIEIYDNVLSKKECEILINQFEKSDEKDVGRTTGGYTPIAFIFPSRRVIGIPSGTSESHLKEFPCHVHSNEIFPSFILTEHRVYSIRRFKRRFFIYKSPVSTNIVCIRAYQ